MIELRDYQIKLIDQFSDAVAKGHRRILAQSWMGSGKSVIGAAVVRHAIEGGLKVLWLVRGRELVGQALDHIQAAGVDAVSMMSGEPYVSSFPCVVASIDTLNSWCLKRRKERIPHAGLVIHDEGHHCAAEGSAKIHALYPNAIILGLTATPITKTGKGLAAYFDTLIQGPSMKWLMENGYLVKEVNYLAPKIEALSQLKSMKIRAGDYVEEELEEKLDKPLLVGDIVKNWLRFTPNKKTMVFGITVAHAQNICNAFKTAGISAAHINAKTANSERDEILKKFRSREVLVLCVCLIGTEGLDIPDMEAIVLARPTKSELLYLQIAGRVMRAFPGKERAWILDHSGAFFEHGRVEDDRVWSLEYNKERNKSGERARKLREKQTIICPTCQIVLKKRIDCPQCGWKPQIKGKPVEALDEWLTYIYETDPELADENRYQWITMLRVYGAQKGYHEWWAKHKFEERFPGEKPPAGWHHFAPLAPSSAVLHWIETEKQKWLASEAGQRWIRNQPGYKAPQREIEASILKRTAWVQQ